MCGRFVQIGKETDDPPRCVFDQNDERKVRKVPQFSPHPPHELILSCINSKISEWHSCLLEFLPAHSTAKSWRLNDLQKPTSCR